ISGSHRRVEEALPRGPTPDSRRMVVQRGLAQARPAHRGSQGIVGPYIPSSTDFWAPGRVYSWYRADDRQSEVCRPSRLAAAKSRSAGQTMPTGTLRQPAVACTGLTLGAVAVSTRVIRDGAMPAANAAITMAAQGGGATTRDGVQNLPLGPSHPGPGPCDE